MTHTRQFFLLSAALLCGAIAHAQVTLPSLFSDHAVLQRQKPIHIWGDAAPGEPIEVRFHGQKVSATTDALGHWELWLKPEPAGGPFTLSVQGAQEAKAIERTDILVGDVWLASGQSNMEFPLAGFNQAPMLHGEEEIAHANQPTLRLLMQPRRTSDTVLSDTTASWTLCNPETARNFSAIEYFFGREISQTEKVPIGLIDSTWGGTPAQSWLSLDAIAYFNLTSVMSDGAQVARDQGRSDRMRVQFAAEDASAKAAGKQPPQHPRIANDHLGSWAPATLFNAMIAPYTRFTIKGALWYQGEADTGNPRASNYARVFSSLIQDWRTQWGEDSLPFLFVQISSYSNNDAGWPTTRDQQRQVAENLPHVGMAVSLDVGLRENVHPPDKQTVAHRLALLARSQVYGETVPADSPNPVRVTAESGQARIWFEHGEGLRATSADLSEFEVAGEDNKFVPATAIIDGTTIVAQSSAVPNPRFIRYGWKGTVTSYVVNGADLPLGTFVKEIR